MVITKQCQVANPGFEPFRTHELYSKLHPHTDQLIAAIIDQDASTHTHTLKALIMNEQAMAPYTPHNHHTLS